MQWKFVVAGYFQNSKASSCTLALIDWKLYAIFLFLFLVPRHSRAHLTNQWPNFKSMWQKSTVVKKWNHFTKVNLTNMILPTQKDKNNCKHVIHQESKCDQMNFLFVVLSVLPNRNPFQILKFVNLSLSVQVKYKWIFNKVLLLLIF